MEEAKEDKCKLYVGNLPYNCRDKELSDMFSVEGMEVTDAKVITDKFNGDRSKGFGFVTLANEEMAEKAVKEFNGKEIEGRAIVVNIARPMQPRTDRNDRR